MQNSKSKFVRNLIFAAVSTTVLSSVAAEVLAITPAELTAACIKKYPNYEDLSAMAKVKAMNEVGKELGIVGKRGFVVAKKAAAPLPVKAPLTHLEEMAAKRKGGGLLGGAKVKKPLTPAEQEAKVKESLAKKEAAKKAANFLTPAQQAKIKAEREAKEAEWEIKRIAREAEKLKEEQKAFREKEAKRVAETRKEAAERDGKSLPESELVKELRAEIDFLKNTLGNPYSGRKVEGGLKENIKTLETTNSDLLIKISLLNEQLEYLQQNNTHSNSENGIGNGNYSLEQEEITRLKDEISSLKALSGEKQRNEEFLDVIEFLKQYISEGGSIQETVEFLEEQRKKGLSLSEAIDFLEEKENMEAMLELQEQEKAIDAQLEQTAEEKITDAEEMLFATSSIPIEIMNSVTDLIKSRISSTSGLVAVAAGDEDTSIAKGVWIAGLYGTNKQGAQKNMPGYKGNTYGSTIGFDVEFNDNDIVGIAYTNMRSNFKTGTTTKGKTAVNSHVLALYGQKELLENFSLQGMFAVARNYIKNKSVYSGSNITGKYKNDSLSFETLLNYKYPTNYGLTVIPNVGIRYGSSKDGIYKDSDLGVQHLTVAAKSQNLWTGIVGTKILFTPQRVAESITLTPGIHGSIENHFNNKNKKVEVQVSWEGRQVKDTIILPKQPKTGYNIGASVLAQKGNVDVLVEYNCHLQKKYQSHQGFVKLKINF